jgi:DNA-binding PadR family transcriptional regulator
MGPGVVARLHSSVDKLDADVYYIEHGYIVDGVFVEKESKGARVREPRELLPLSPAVLHILLALADEERHGYGIMREVEGRTGGQNRLGPGTLYGSIKRMLADGLIEESDERPDPAMDDQRRRYYKITDFGRRVAGAEAERLSGLVETARARKLLRGRGSSAPEGV